MIRTGRSALLFAFLGQPVLLVGCGAVAAAEPGSDCAAIVQSSCSYVHGSYCPYGYSLSGSTCSRVSSNLGGNAPLTMPALPAWRVEELIPSTPAGQQLQWYLGLINVAGGVVTSSELQAHMTSQVIEGGDFGGKKGAAGWIEFLKAQKSIVHTLDFTSVDMLGCNSLFGSLTSVDGTGYWIFLRVDPSNGNKIAELAGGGGKDQQGAADWPWASCDNRNAGQELSDFIATHPSHGLWVAKLDEGGAWRSLISRRTSTATPPIASVFKLWVLAALVEQMNETTLTWDSLLPSNPSLVVPTSSKALWTAGTSHSLRDLATLMIQNSDNTATDHLIDFLGRGKIEDMFGMLGRRRASPVVWYLPPRKSNNPLLMTAEVCASAPAPR